ncbi:MAG: MFS transporter [Xanthomonadales bacterium]|nr:MFS transporter [Xanthomonadales bacterium]
MSVKSGPKRSLFDREWRALSIGSIGLCSMVAFEAIGVAAGMPAVAMALDGVPLYALAFAGTLAGSLIAMVWAGRDCDHHGPMRAMAGGLLMFTAGLLIAGLAASMATLVAGRIVQGFGVGALVVALYVASARRLPDSLHPRLFALFSAAWVVPAIVGPAISGWIVEQLGWRWLFLGIATLLLPVAALVLPPLRGLGAVNGARQGRLRQLPWAFVASVGSIALSASASAGSWKLPLIAIALAGIALAATQLLPKGTLRLRHGLPTVIALRGLNSSAFFLCEAFVPLWLHQQRGWSLTHAGLALTGGALSWSIGSHAQSRIEDAARRQTWLGRGCLFMTAGISLCAAAVLGIVPDWSMLLGWSLTGLGMGLAFPMLAVLTLKLAPVEQQGRYSSALQIASSLGTAATLAVGGLAFSILQPSSPATAFSVVFLLAGGIAALSAITSPRVFPGSG